MNSNSIRLAVVILMFLAGVTSLYSSLPNYTFDTSGGPLGWLALIWPLLVLVGAYGLGRQIAAALYVMYAYLAIALLVIILAMVQVGFHWQLLVGLVFPVATTYYVHQHFALIKGTASAPRNYVKEAGFFMIYVFVVFLGLLGVGFVQGPSVHTLSGPVSIEK